MTREHFEQHAAAIDQAVDQGTMHLKANRALGGAADRRAHRRCPPAPRSAGNCGRVRHRAHEHQVVEHQAVPQTVERIVAARRRHDLLETAVEFGIEHMSIRWLSTRRCRRPSSASSLPAGATICWKLRSSPASST